MRMMMALCLFLTAAAASAQTIDAGRGDIALTVPARLSGDTPAPLIVLLHGYGSSGAGQDSYMKFSALADRYGFFLVTPDGTEEAAGRKNRFWNASKACCNFFATDLDDSAYVLSIINTVKAQYSIDERRVYLIGHSNGGFMSYKAAHDHSDVIAALVSLAGAEATDPLPAPANPVHVLQIHGTADGTIAYEGSEIRGNIYPGAVETVERWAGYNGCTADGRVTGMLDLEPQLEGLETTVVRYTQNCRPGGSSELWTIAEGSHIPALTDAFSEKVVEWLLGHPKVPVSSSATD
jgi:polyhydroxybutyrate depolymerase